MAAQNMPAAEVDVTEDLVRDLLVEQHPDLADLPLVVVANGWDNVILRLGGDLSVRVPRRQAAAALVTNEQRWLPELALRLPLPVPVPLRRGVPTDFYPWHWSVCPWFDGELAADVAPVGRVVAQQLGRFLTALHTPAPVDLPVNAALRGGPIAALGDRFVGNVAALGTHIDASAVLARWDELAAAEEWSGEPQWLHGDLHTANVLLRDGSISAVIDFGDIGAGDPAVDLAIGWMLFDDRTRAVFRSALGGVDEATWQRAQAWGLHFALLYLLHSVDAPRFERMGRNLLAQLVAD
ncbi:MAG: aminoglycoside phosphotransferase family protein [Ilumatobacteraceae bacterium]